MGFKGPSQDQKSTFKDETKNEDPHSYVLITCEEPIDGEIKVAMTYQGDPTLISCLLHDAQNIIDQQEED